MSWTLADMPDQHGRTAVVTGANGGLGYETAVALAAKGAHVVVAAHNRAKAERAIESLRATVPDASVELVPLDLGGSCERARRRGDDRPRRTSAWTCW